VLLEVRAQDLPDRLTGLNTLSPGGRKRPQLLCQKGESRTDAAPFKEEKAGEELLKRGKMTRASRPGGKLGVKSAVFGALLSSRRKGNYIKHQEKARALSGWRGKSQTDVC